LSNPEFDSNNRKSVLARAGALESKLSQTDNPRSSKLPGKLKFSYTQSPTGDIVNN